MKKSILMLLCLLSICFGHKRWTIGTAGDTLRMYGPIEVYSGGTLLFSVGADGYATFAGNNRTQWQYQTDAFDSTHYYIRTGVKSGFGIYPNSLGYAHLNIFQNNISPRGMSGINFIEKCADGIYRPTWGWGGDIVRKLVTSDSLSPVMIPLFRWSETDNSVEDMASVNLHNWINGTDSMFVGQWSWNVVPTLQGTFSFGDRTEHPSNMPIIQIHKGIKFKQKDWLQMTIGTSGFEKMSINWKGDITWRSGGLGTYDYDSGMGARLSFDNDSSNVATWCAGGTIVNSPVSFQGESWYSDRPSVAIRGNYDVSALGGIPILKLQNYFNGAGRRMSISNYSYSGNINASIDFINNDIDQSGDVTINTRTTSGSLVERIRITHDGNVGIGDATPDAKLDVEGGGLLATDSLRVGVGGIWIRNIFQSGTALGFVYYNAPLSKVDTIFVGSYYFKLKTSSGLWTYISPNSTQDGIKVSAVEP